MKLTASRRMVAAQFNNHIKKNFYGVEGLIYNLLTPKDVMFMSKFNDASGVYVTVDGKFTILQDFIPVDVVSSHLQWLYATSGIDYNRDEMYSIYGCNLLDLTVRVMRLIGFKNTEDYIYVDRAVDHNTISTFNKINKEDMGRWILQ